MSSLVVAENKSAHGNTLVRQVDPTVLNMSNLSLRLQSQKHLQTAGTGVVNMGSKCRAIQDAVGMSWSDGLTSKLSDCPPLYASR
ncbi:hypothetical protein MN608_06198 [Microdochium nivale]|nr:hypothetical protein MN608_06198 [Microdochium nivale]